MRLEHYLTSDFDEAAPLGIDIACHFSIPVTHLRRLFNSRSIFVLSLGRRSFVTFFQDLGLLKVLHFLLQRLVTRVGLKCASDVTF